MSKMHLKLMAITVFCLFGLLACESGAAEKRGIVIAKSDAYEATIYKQNCAICHGPEAYGKTIQGQPVPALRFGDAAKKSEDQIYQQISHGKLPMPSFKNQLTESERRKMARFIVRDLQGRKPEAE